MPRKGQKTGSLRGLETACVTSPGEGSGKGDVGRGVFVFCFFFLKGQVRLLRFLPLALGVSKQEEGRFLADRLKDTSRAAGPVKPARSSVFLTSRERYVPSAEPAAGRLSGGRSPKSDPSSVSHSPRRAVTGHPSTSCSATRVPGGRKGRKSKVIIPRERQGTRPRAARADGPAGARPSPLGALG